MNISIKEAQFLWRALQEAARNMESDYAFQSEIKVFREWRDRLEAKLEIHSFDERRDEDNQMNVSDYVKEQLRAKQKEALSPIKEHHGGKIVDGRFFHKNYDIVIEYRFDGVAWRYDIYKKTSYRFVSSFTNPTKLNDYLSRSFVAPSLF